MELFGTDVVWGPGDWNTDVAGWQDVDTLGMDSGWRIAPQSSASCRHSAGWPALLNGPRQDELEVALKDAIRSQVNLTMEAESGT